MVLDEDGTVWMAHPSEGGVDGVTADVLASLLPSLGMPVVKGKLNNEPWLDALNLCWSAPAWGCVE